MTAQLITFITSNDNKAREVEAILGMKVEKVDIELPEIQALDVEDVVIDKAKGAYEAVKRVLVVEDTGLYISSLNGFPGALAKWVLKTLGRETLCELLSGKDRSAMAKTCVCLHDGKKFHLFIGSIKGTIAQFPRGNSGFGWDSIFIPEGYDKTFAELGSVEKNKISMRQIAFRKLHDYFMQGQQ